MDQQLQVINQKFSRSEKYMTSREYGNPKDAEYKEALKDYRLAHDKFWEIVPRYSPSQIAEAYKEGGEYLRGSIIGWIWHLYESGLTVSDEYVSMAIEAIAEDNCENLNFLVLILAEIAPRQTLVMVLRRALSSKSTRTVETALTIVEKKNVEDVKVSVKALMKHKTKHISVLAVQVHTKIED